MASLARTPLEQSVVDILGDQGFGRSDNSVAHDLHQAKYEIVAHGLPKETPVPTVRASFFKQLDNGDACRVTICSMGPNSTPDHYFITGVVGSPSLLADLGRARTTLHAPGIALSDFVRRVGSQDVSDFFLHLQAQDEQALASLSAGLAKKASVKHRAALAHEYRVARRPWLAAPLPSSAPVPAA